MSSLNINKEFDLSKFKMGYVILYKSGQGKFGKSIVKAQLKAGFSEDEASYTHSEISGGNEHSVNIAPPLSKLVNILEAHKGRYIKLLRYNNENYEKKGRYKVAYFSASLCNLGYDIRGVVKFMFKWVGNNNRLYFCSEGVAYSIQKVYPSALGKKPEKIMPAHFARSSEFTTVWEGFIPK